jgi:hypothetical protein
MGWRRGRDGRMRMVPQGMGQRPYVTGERALLVALLEEAIQSAAGRATHVGGGSKRDGWAQRRGLRVQREAQAWFRGVDMGGLTFVGVCEHLGLEADVLRRAVLGEAAA